VKKKKGQHNQSSKESVNQCKCQARQPQGEPQQTTCNPCKYWGSIKYWTKLFFQCVLFALNLSAICGIVSFYYEFSPNVSVTPHVGFAGRNPLATPFVITNNSHLDLNNVSVTCIFPEVQYTHGHTLKRSRLNLESIESLSVAAGESLTISCEQLFGTDRELLSATAKINVTFKVFPYEWFRIEHRTFLFDANRSENGNWFWLPQPLDQIDK
jgi:hypothetical protein